MMIKSAFGGKGGQMVGEGKHKNGEIESLELLALFDIHTHTHTERD